MSYNFSTIVCVDSARICVYIINGCMWIASAECMSLLLHYYASLYSSPYILSQKHSISYLAWILKWNDIELVKGFVLNLFYQVWSQEIELQKDMDDENDRKFNFSIVHTYYLFISIFFLIICFVFYTCITCSQYNFLCITSIYFVTCYVEK